MTMLSSLVTGYKVPTKTHGPHRTGKGFCMIYCSRKKMEVFYITVFKEYV